MGTSEPEIPIIDQDLCTGCGLCVQICPDRILVLASSGKAEVEGDHCMQCGHCYAVCPEEAVGVPFLDAPVTLCSIGLGGPKSGTEPVSSADLIELMKNRRSCRLYLDQPVDRVVLKDLVKAGLTAPSGTNSQGWRFLILEQRRDVARLGEATADFYRRINRKAANPLLRIVLRLAGQPALQNYYERYYRTVKEALEGWDRFGDDRLFHGAPAAIVVACSTASSCPGEDALLASQNILLMAESMGLGCCLIGYVVEAAQRDPSINHLLGLDKTEQIYSVVAVGHPAVKFMRPAGRKFLRSEFVNPA